MRLDRSWFTGLGYEKVEHAGKCFSSYAQTGDRQMLEDVIALTASAQSEAITPSGLSATHFLHGEALRVRYDLTGSLDDLQWALRAMRQATEEDPSEDRAYRLRLLGETLLIVIEMLEPGESLVESHLELAEQWLTEATRLLGPEEAPMARSSLGMVRFQRCRHFGSTSDWNTAFDDLVAAREAATNDSDRAKIWANLGKILAFRYNNDPSTEVAGQVLQAFGQAAEVCPPDDPDYRAHQQQYAMTRRMLGLEG